MIRKSILLMFAVVAIVAGAAAFMLIHREPEWTTSKPEALAEFQAGLDAEQRFYHADAMKHYERALKIDPGFVAAKLRLTDGAPKEKIKSIVADLQTIDKDRLNSRERFFVDLTLARFQGNRAEAKQLTDAYIAEHPRDVWGLSARCNDLWSARDFPNAKPCYQQMLKIAPNWVTAQNNLGYLEMAQGHFAEAENAFGTYRYIAPDQANPHDSLGELFTLVGRYDDAEKELRQALKVRPDFCDSWGHLMDLALLEGNYTKAEQVVSEASTIPACSERIPSVNRERIAIWRMADEGDAEGILAVPKDQLPRHANDIRIMRQAAAMKVGNSEEAKSIESEFEYEPPMKDQKSAKPTLWFLQARRLASQGDPKGAVELLRKADDAMVFWGEADGVFKLAIKALLGRTLIDSGDTQAGEATLREVDQINPKFRPRFKGTMLELR